MNRIEFKRLTFRNFMSYGNNLNELLFTDGLIWLSADNGSGKSTLVEVLMFALFGTSYRGGNKGDLRNSRNIDGITEVSLEFRRIAGDEPEEYRLFRSIDPKGKIKFELERQVDGEWVSQNKRAGFSQKDFEDKLLQFNDTLFKNVIAMNTQESLPFIDMPAARKRELLESIIAMSMDRWKKENGKRQSATTIECATAQKEVERLTAELGNMDVLLARMKQERDEGLAALRRDLDTKNAERSSAVDGYNEIKRDYDVLDAEKTGYEGELSSEPGVDASITKMREIDKLIAPLAANKAKLAELTAELETARMNAPAIDVQQISADIAAIDNENLGLDRTSRTLMAETSRMGYDISRIEGELKQLETQAASFVAGTPCPTCGKPSTEDDVERHKSVLRTQWKEKKAQLVATQHALASKTAEYNDILAKMATNNDKKNDLDIERRKYDTYFSENVNPIEHTVATYVRNISADERKIAASGVDVAEIEENIAKLSVRKSELVAIRAKYSELMPSWQAKYTELQGSVGKINGIDGEITRIHAEIARMESASSDDAYAVACQQRNAAAEDLETANRKLSESSDTLEICKYISNICSDNGMKKMIFGLFVPAFNNAVHKNMVRAGLPFSVKFDDTMDFEFISNPGQAPKYEMTSQGQKRKIGFAISMAFRDFVSLVGNFSVNFLSLDEVLDISTDNTAMRDMLDVVRDMVDSIGCAMVITHRGDVVADKFDYRLGIEYDGNYSRIGKLVSLR